MSYASPSANKSKYGAIIASSPHDDMAADAAAMAGVKAGPSRLTATIGLVVSFIFVGAVFLVATADSSKSYSYSKLGNSIETLFGQPGTLDASGPSTTTGVVGTSTTTTTVVTTTTKPNFVLIVADDLGWNSLGYNDQDLEFATPILTKLAKSGITMGNFYAQEVCSPSRASLLTGRYPLSTGMQYGMVAATAEWGLPLDEITLAEVLQDEHYSTHMLGKWHLGYFSPLFIPTARGFDDFTGYFNGENYYWSKRSPDYPEFTDFVESDKDCYRPYNGSDKHTYSTTFYTDKALEIIEQHPVTDPLFLYMAYQAVHDPFVDTGKFKNGMPDSMLDADVLSTIHTTIKGRQRQEYIKSLYILDKSVGYIYEKLVAKDMMDNTYIIFMSDNGGCFYGGGKNGPLRGSKGSLFEGGIKVDSFIYSPKLMNTGVVYTGLMHVSDWFPTILALGGITYEADEDHALDGVNQIDGWLGASTPRDSMLYNMYVHLTDYSFNIWYNGSFAVRDARFKLMHTYNDTDYGAWYQPETEIETDEDLDDDNRCAQQFLTGDFTYWMFDLEADPYETNNIYDSTADEHVTAKEKLYTLLPGYMDRAKTKISIHWSNKSKRYWQAADNNVLPWANTDTLVNEGVKDYPVYCP